MAKMACETPKIAIFRAGRCQPTAGSPRCIGQVRCKQHALMTPRGLLFDTYIAVTKQRECPATWGIQSTDAVRSHTRSSHEQVCNCAIAGGGNVRQHAAVWPALEFQEYTPGELNGLPRGQCIYQVSSKVAIPIALKQVRIAVAKEEQTWKVEGLFLDLLEQSVTNK